MRLSSYQAERGELEEFEILEQYADDNASFLSSLSAVNRVLHGEEARPGRQQQHKRYR